ncbi:hypothetical protein CFR71_09850 [Novacetimonas pomaceti]|uniref:Uncharacterized protein n=1 Tax=Novacetimonas pomaceti TaxID=2021998 RepID=A0A318QJB2_9PROT|nr:hypothetical protein CFR71_09850 [Novacetimonas pomaceti]
MKIAPAARRGVTRAHASHPPSHAMFMPYAAGTVTKNRLASSGLHGPNRGSSTRCQDEIRIGNGF